MRVVSVGFPASGVALGGIGTGSIEIRPDGRLYEWLIFNNKPWSGYGEPEFPMGPDDLVFALRARAPGEEPVVRLLQTGIWRDREGLCASYRSCGGCVIDPYHTPWVRGVERIEFDGRPPIARLRYADSAFDELGLCVELEAFSPIIPGDLRSSSLPVAVFRFRLRNIGRHRLELALMALSKNPFSSVEGAVPRNRGVQTGEFTGIEFLGEGVPPHHGMYGGSMAMGFVGGADSLASFLVSGECGAVEVIRRVLVDFRGDGVVEGSPDAQGLGELYGVVTRRVSLGPGEEAEVTLVLAWFFPNHVDYMARVLGHYYENMFSSAVEVASYVSKHVDLLRERVRAFVDAIYDATYPEWIKDLVSSQVSTLAKSTWLTREGVFVVWEGGPGCCGLNTVDVALWGFVGVALLFPDLVRRAVEHIASLILKPGKSPFYEIYALALPENMRFYRELLARDPSIQHDVEKFRRAVKSIVEKTGRDPRGRVPHLLHGTIDRVDGYDRVDLMPEFLLLVALVYRWTGDVGFLKRLWPRVKEVVDAVLRQHDDAGLKLPYHAPPSGWEGFSRVADAMAFRTGLRTWDAVRNIAMRALFSGPMYVPVAVNTFDAMSLVGVAVFTSDLWVAALRSVAAMASVVGDGDAQRYTQILDEARRNLVDKLWNGEYFDLWYDPVSGYRDRACMSAALTGEWYLEQILGMGYAIDRGKVLSTLRAIYRYNFRKWEGLLNATYPGKPRPALSGDMKYFNPLGIPYTISSQMDTPWTGVEVAVAMHMVWEGMVSEGLKILEAVHRRYESWGLYWNHVECDGHYLRPLVALALPNALAGARYVGAERSLTISPRLDTGRVFRGPILLPGSVATLEVDRGRGEVVLRVRLGRFRLRRLSIGLPGERVVAELDGRPVEVRTCRAVGVLVVEFAEEPELAEGSVLRLRLLPRAG